MAVSDGVQQNMVSNRARHLIFVEGTDLCYNYKTGQWSLVSAYDGFGFYSVNSENQIVGLIRYSSGAASLEAQLTFLGEAQTATITTGERDINETGRTYVDNVLPLVNGGTVTARVGVRDDITTAVSWRTGTAVNTRTGRIHFRNADNGPPEGRYVRAEFTIAGGFTTALGTDVEWFPSGDV